MPSFSVAREADGTVETKDPSLTEVELPTRASGDALGYCGRWCVPHPSRSLSQESQLESGEGIPTLGGKLGSRPPILPTPGFYRQGTGSISPSAVRLGRMMLNWECPHVNTLLSPHVPTWLLGAPMLPHLGILTSPAHLGSFPIKLKSVNASLIFRTSQENLDICFP